MTITSAIEKTTPLMEQYFAVKAQYPDTLVLFQVGDFYELFFDDAKTAASFLALTLTKRGKNKGEDIPLCGVPVHAVAHYLQKLIKGGFRVAICDQLTKPSPGTVVERGVTNVFTPGTLTDDNLLDQRSASYLLSFYPTADRLALVFGELLTAQLFATTLPTTDTRAIESELIRFFPDEVLLAGGKAATGWSTYFKGQGYCTTIIDLQAHHSIRFASQNTQDARGKNCHATSVHQDEQHKNIPSTSARPECQPQAGVSKDRAETDTPGTPIAKAWIEHQFNSVAHQQLNNHPEIEASLSLLYYYLKKNQERALDQFKTIQFYEPEDYLILDAATQRNLELVANTQDGGRKNTLLAVVDQAKTPMGSRTVKKWLLRPLVQKATIIQRHEIVDALCSRIEILQQLGLTLTSIADLERIIGRIALGRATLLDYLALKNSLTVVPQLKSVVSPLAANQLGAALYEKLGDFNSLVILLETSLNDNPSVPGTIKQGFDLELDRLRSLLSHGQQAILELESKEIINTGITSLKIGYTAISGYYIEITNPNLTKVPSTYQYQQTLVNRKRFITPELKQLEADLFKAQNEIATIETTVFDRVKREVLDYLAPLRQTAQSLGYLDALFGFAWAAYHNQYTRPQFNDHCDIIVTAGRHPVVEQTLGSAFISNDTTLTNQESLWIITGPNMGGKSTYLRQVALICLMAQCGAFVPSSSANLPILDRIFTRIGAGDNVAQGKSTFLVEMEETATICLQATKNSLVILDEVGRGTSTFDGMALAQAIIEYLATQIQPRCLFATHFHELTHLSSHITTIANYHADCKKVNDSIIFLHKITKGTATSSFGLEVAKLANIPQSIIKRATTLLKTLEQPMASYRPGQTTVFEQANAQKTEVHQQREQQCAVYESCLKEIKNVDFNSITPKQAFDLLWNIKQKIE